MVFDPYFAEYLVYLPRCSQLIVFTSEEKGLEFDSSVLGFRVLSRDEFSACAKTPCDDSACI